MAIYARLENGTYAEVTGVYKTDGTEITEIFQGDRLVYSATNEIYGTLPLYYNGKGFELIDYVIYGNALQDGTPSADAPVDATGSGVRTGNLFDADFVQGGVLTDGNLTNATTSARAKVFVQPGMAYSFSCNCLSRIVYAYRDDDTPVGILSDHVSGQEVISFSTPEGAKYVWICVMNEGGAGAISPSSVKDIMLNLGSTALPYEPYGYKLPLTVNATEYPIYLGKVPTTRRIKKLVLTGEESFSAPYGNSIFYVFSSGIGIVAHIAYEVLCTHFARSETNAAMQMTDNKILLSSTSLYIRMDAATTVADFKSYLAAQYQNGTPVIVWYVLAEPETAIVNEPLMKIGDYADTVSFAQAGVTIPTVNGANVLDMTSPVKPSEIYIKGKGIKPTGYGQLVDVNGVNILDKDNRPIYVHGQ